ncbi:unnamed protein product, partial [Amoebophrya sp. A25]
RQEHVIHLLQKLTEPVLDGLFTHCRIDAARSRIDCRATSTSSVVEVGHDASGEQNLLRESGRELVKDLFDVWYRVKADSAKELYKVWTSRLQTSAPDLLAVEVLLFLCEGFVEASALYEEGDLFDRTGGPHDQVTHNMEGCSSTAGSSP